MTGEGPLQDLEKTTHCLTDSSVCGWFRAGEPVSCPYTSAPCPFWRTS